MSDKPILFSGPMVRALLAGTKTQTRRIIKPQPIVEANGAWRWEGRHGGFVGAMGTHVDRGFPSTAINHARYQIGDRLWVGEAYYLTDNGHNERAVYSAEQGSAEDHISQIRALEASHPNGAWGMHKRLRPSIHMPRWASRITLSVTDVRVERLQAISENDAEAEGCEPTTCANVLRPAFGFPSHRSAYAILWEALNGPGSWEANPWVAAYTFTVTLGNIDEFGK